MSASRTKRNTNTTSYSPKSYAAVGAKDYKKAEMSRKSDTLSEVGKEIAERTDWNDKGPENPNDEAFCKSETTHDPYGEPINLFTLRARLVAHSDQQTETIKNLQNILAILRGNDTNGFTSSLEEERESNGLMQDLSDIIYGNSLLHSNIDNLVLLIKKALL